MMDLRKQRLRLIADHQAMEKYEPHWKAEAAAGRKISEQPIAFLCDDDVCLFDECVDKAREGLKRFLLLTEENSEFTAEQSGVPTFVSAVKLAQLYAFDTANAWRIPQQRWNSITYALAEVGVNVVVTEGTYLPRE